MQKVEVLIVLSFQICKALKKKTQQRKHQSSLEYYKLCLNASQKLADEKMETYV